jgi:hypothetical protein
MLKVNNVKFASLGCGNVNQKSIVKKDLQHQFNARESAHGFADVFVIIH